MQFVQQIFRHMLYVYFPGCLYSKQFMEIHSWGELFETFFRSRVVISTQRNCAWIYRTWFITASLLHNYVSQSYLSYGALQLFWVWGAPRILKWNSLSYKKIPVMFFYAIKWIERLLIMTYMLTTRFIYMIYIYYKKK